jgi:hypothetical protein
MTDDKSEKIGLDVRYANPKHCKEPPQLKGSGDPADDRKDPFRRGEGRSSDNCGNVKVVLAGHRYQRTVRGSNGQDPSRERECELLEEDQVDARIHEWDGAAAVFPGLWHLRQ